MKFSDDMRFPHPVLSHSTADFAEGEFQFGVEIEERPRDGQVTILYNCNITEPSVHDLVECRRARVGLFVAGEDTFLNRLEGASLGSGKIQFEGGLLSGRVVLRPVIWTNQRVTDWHSGSLHQEFGSGPVSVDEFELIGIGDEIIINVGWEKLRPLETIFTLAVSPDFIDGRIAIDLEADRIRILVSQNTHDSINRYRGYAGGKAILLNGVYFPAVMEALRSLSLDRERHEQRRWYRPFVAKCDHFNINLQNPDLLEDAERLLARPYSRLIENEERLS